MGTPREELAKKLREARIAAGYETQSALARALNVSRPVISKAENPAQAIPNHGLLNAWAGVTGVAVDEITELVGRAKSGTPEWFMPFQIAEAKAHTLRYWSPTVVPGIAQTRGYMRALFEGEGHLLGQIDELVTARVQRQDVIGRAHVTVIIGRQVLDTLVGSAAVMAEQCTYLAKVAELPGVALHVLPEGTNMGLWGALAIATYDIGTVVCLTSLEDITSTSPDMVIKASHTFERILGAALPRAESLEIIRTAEERWKTYTWHGARPAGQVTAEKTA
jgi:transcriptional regulator with XRE-family HTH domain